MVEKTQKINSYVGIDLGKRSMEVVRLIEGKKPIRARFQTAKTHLSLLSSWLKKNDVVAMEVCELAFFICRYLKQKVGCEVLLLNAGDLATIYKSLKKTDAEDALKIAKLIQRFPVEELPVVSLPTEEEEKARKIASENQFLKKSRTRLINRLHAIFVREGMTKVTKADLKSLKRRAKLIDMLNEFNGEEAKRLIEQIEILERQIKELVQKIKKVLKANGELTRLYMSMPGIGPQAAMILLGYLGKGQRFSHAEQVSYYSGLVPRVDCSGDSNRYGNITKRGCRLIRSVICQSAWALSRSSNGGRLKTKFHQLSMRIGKNKAIVATSRKMLEVLYVMAKNGQVYEGVDDEFIDKKLKQYGLLMA